MSYAAQFLASPTKENLLDLMHNCIVQTFSLKTTTYGMPQSLTFKEKSPEVTVKGGKTTPMLRLLDSSKDQESFESYICDYKDGEINYQVLDKKADFCFTWTMNGCTFGIGKPAADGSVLVSHGNVKGMGVPRGCQQEAQASLANQMHGGQVSLLEPITYRQGGDEMSTTFGIREGTAWKFYYQSYRRFGLYAWQLLGVSTIETKNFDSN